MDIKSISDLISDLVIDHSPGPRKRLRNTDWHGLGGYSTSSNFCINIPKYDPSYCLDCKIPSTIAEITLNYKILKSSITIYFISVKFNNRAFEGPIIEDVYGSKKAFQAAKKSSIKDYYKKYNMTNPFLDKYLGIDYLNKSYDKFLQLTNIPAPSDELKVIHYTGNIYFMFYLGLKMIKDFKSTCIKEYDIVDIKINPKVGLAVPPYPNTTIDLNNQSSDTYRQQIIDNPVYPIGCLQSISNDLFIYNKSINKYLLTRKKDGILSMILKEFI